MHIFCFETNSIFVFKFNSINKFIPRKYFMLIQNKQVIYIRNDGTNEPKPRKLRIINEHYSNYRMSENYKRLFWSTPNKTTPRRVNDRATANLFTIFFFVYPKIFFVPTAILWTNIRTKILADYQSSVLETYWISTKISKKRESANYHQNNYDYENNYFLLHWIKKFSSPKMQNRQFIFAPKIQYKLIAERSEANLSNLQFPTWWSYLTPLVPILSQIPDLWEAFLPVH